MIKESKIKHIEGHKDSEGELAPWVIVDHDTGEILFSHQTKEEAEEQLQNMHIHSSSLNYPYLGIDSLDELIKKAKYLQYPQYVDYHSELTEEEPFTVDGKVYEYCLGSYPVPSGGTRINVAVYSYDENMCYGYEWFNQNIL